MTLLLIPAADALPALREHFEHYADDGVRDEGAGSRDGRGGWKVCVTGS